MNENEMKTENSAEALALADINEEKSPAFEAEKRCEIRRLRRGEQKQLMTRRIIPMIMLFPQRKKKKKQASRPPTRRKPRGKKLRRKNPRTKIPMAAAR